MTDIEKNRLLASEICSIIQACAHSGVATLKFGDLDLTFEPRNPWSTAEIQTTGPIPSSGTEIPDAQLKKLTQEALEREAIDRHDLEVDEMPISSPLDYEEMLARGELEDVDNG